MTDKEIHFNHLPSKNRCITGNVFETWFNKFKIFASRDTLAPDKTSVVIMATFAVPSILRLESRDTYTLKHFVHEIQNNGLLIEGERYENSLRNNTIDLD